MKADFKFASILFGALALGGFMVFQASKQGVAEVFMPSKLLEQSKNAELQRIRVVGRVAASEISYSVEPQFELRFRIVDPGVVVNAVAAAESSGQAATVPASVPASVPVYYRGIKPDMFAVGRDVILDGEFSKGEVQAQKLLTQCPSKYEAPDPAKKYAAPAASK